MDRVQLEAHLNELAVIAEEFGLREEAHKPLERLADLQLGTFVMIVGEGNFGKSSLINAIAQQAIAATSVLPNTARVDIYTHSKDGGMRAMIRRRGEPSWTEYEWNRAKEICANDEQRVLLGDEPELADAVWYVPNTAIPDGVCLVDTPGLSQDLLGNLEPRSLVGGIDATYSIEDVWAYWIHRADFVLWVFESNRIESKATHEALTGFLSVYKKPILPVATKIDRVREELRQEIPERFKKNFRQVVEQTKCEDVVCVCTAPNEKLFGYGIKELREHVQALAADAGYHKLQATEGFVVQQAALLEKELTSVASTVVDNLVTIATLGDECAGILETAIQEIEHAACRYTEQHFTHKVNELDNWLPAYFESWKQLADSKGRAAAKEVAESDMRRYADVDRLSDAIRAHASEGAEYFAHRCHTEASRRTIHSVRLSMSGQVKHRPQKIDMTIQPFDIQINPENINLPIPNGSCLVLLFVVLNALAGLSFFIWQVVS